MISYKTNWVQGNKKGVYQTKSLTKVHKNIHDDCRTDYALTTKSDTTIDWPFGIFSEVLAITDKKHPNKNQSFKTII